MASLMSGLISDASLYMFFGVHCNQLACEAESKVRMVVDARVDLVFFSGESLFPMMLVLFNAAASLVALFGGHTSEGAGSCWLVS